MTRQIAESIAAQRRLAWCEQVNVSYSGIPEGLLWMVMAWCDQGDCTIYHYST